MSELQKVWVKAKPWLAIVLGIITSAFLLILAMPLGEQHYLAWFALVPLIASTRNKGFLIGFIAGLLCIVVLATVAISGILYKTKSYGGNEAWIITGCGVFGFAIALSTAIFADTKLGNKPIWWLAACAVLLESILLFELPGHMALTQYRHGGSMAIASIGGVWLLSYLIWLSNIWISKQAGWQRFLWIAGTCIVVAVASKGWRPHSPVKGTVALIQSPNEEETQMVKFHQEAARLGAKLAVWPEFGGIMFLRRDDTSQLQDISDGLPLVTSWPDSSKPKPFNVASLFANGTASERYQKRKLFGAESKQHQPGNKPVSVPFENHRLGLNICFDSCFPYVIRETARISDFIALPTIDPESPHGFLAAMHAAYTPIRSAETGVALFRADGYAYSMATDGFGNIVAESGIGPSLTLAPLTVPDKSRPLATRVGDGVLWLCGIAVIAGCFLRAQPRADNVSLPASGI